MGKQLVGKVALVTGASSGLGCSFSEVLAGCRGRDGFRMCSEKAASGGARQRTSAVRSSMLCCQTRCDRAQHSIRVNVLAPGYVETDLNREFFHSSAGEKMIARIPNLRLGTMMELAMPLLLLCGDGSRSMTGSVLVVDGGHSIVGL